MSRLESEEIRDILESASSLSPITLYDAVLHRVKAVAPPRHYKGFRGFFRRSRIWWRCYGEKIAVGSVVFLGVIGAIALLVVCPLAGVLVFAQIALVAGSLAATENARSRSGHAAAAPETQPRAAEHAWGDGAQLGAGE